MIRTHARLVLVAAFIAGCGSNPVTKPIDAASLPDLGAGTGGTTGPDNLTGGASGTSGTGGTAGMGGTGGTAGTGGAGGLAEPPVDGAVVDAQPDATLDVTPDVVDAQPDMHPDTAEAGPVCGAPVCVAGDKRCGTGGGLQTCALVNGCPAWAAEVACGANRTCTGIGAAAACTCNAAPTGCTAKGNFCMSTGARATCEQDANGCFFVSPSSIKTCGARQSCSGHLPTADCTCGNGAAGCSAEGTFCSNATTISTCTKDADGCLFKSGTDMSCGSGKVCAASGNTAMCACPAVGTALGTGCTSVGVAACGGNSLLTCTLDPVSACKTWTLTTDCAGTGMVCGTKSGAAACQCQDVTDGKYYVDPVAGSDATTLGARPTGAQSPPSCRLKSLTKATQLAQSGNQIIASTQTLPGVFTGETFPLQIPANVHLTTSDATPTPIDYVIQFNGTSGNAIQLANGASISGFTFNNISGGLSNSAVALSCTGGTVTASHLLVNGSSSTNTMPTGIAVGTAATDTCSATLDTVTVDGFAAGVHVDGTGTATLNTSIVKSSQPTDVGVLISAGTLKANDLTVSAHGSGGHPGYAVRVVPASQTVQASFDISNLQAVGPANDAVSLESGGANMAAPKGSLTGGAITAPTGATSSGIFIGAGTLTVTGTTITTPGEYGLQIEGGTFTATGLTVSGAGKDGVHVQGAASGVTLHQSQVTLSGHDNVAVTAGTVVIDDTSSLTNAMTGDGIDYTGGANTDLTVGGTTGGTVTISGNAGHGVEINGAGGAGSTIHLERTSLHANKLDGLHVAFTSNATRVSALNCEIDANAQNGVVVTSAPSSSGTTNAVVLDTLDVHGHTASSGATVGHGVWLHGNVAGGGDIAATLSNSKVHDNHNVGVVIDEDTTAPNTTITRETLTNNDVSANNSAAVDTATGGILFATGSTLTAFSGNKVHGNRRDQIGFLAPQNGGADWDLRPGTSCAAAINSVYCYSSDANSVGIRVSAATATTVEARNIAWQHKPPTTANKDFAVTAGNTVNVGTDANANACTPITTCL